MSNTFPILITPILIWADIGANTSHVQQFHCYSAVDWVENEYCCKRCYASAFVLEEAIKRLGIPQKD